MKELLNKSAEEFDKVKIKFMHDIENGREDGMYVLDTSLFWDWHKLQMELAYRLGKEEGSLELDKLKKELEDLKDELIV